MGHSCHRFHGKKGSQMNLLDLAIELNLSPKKVASTYGGEYKSACPNCQTGKDRFCIWPNQGELGRYWCRVCECKGDGIQFCRDFLGMSYPAACQNVGVGSKFQDKLFCSNPYKSKEFVPKQADSVTREWQQAAKNFIEASIQRLMSDQKALELLFQRGLSLQTIQMYNLGWNPSDHFEARKTWGLPEHIKENGQSKRQWLPKGIIIPTFEGYDPVKIKIRRSNWKPDDSFPKYVEVSGGKQCLSIFGEPGKPVIIVESELDAILIQQDASHLVWSVALGGVSKKPDKELDRWLKNTPLILLSLDHDEVGKKQYVFWMKHYPNLRPWPTPKSKSPGDALRQFNLDITKWISKGLIFTR